MLMKSGMGVVPGRAGDVHRLHDVLLRALADRPDGMSLTTAELCRQVHRELISDSSPPVAIEAVYRALRTLHRRGQVAHHRPAGRHAQWCLTPSGAARRHARTSHGTATP